MGWWRADRLRCDDNDVVAGTAVATGKQIQTIDYQPLDRWAATQNNSFCTGNYIEKKGGSNLDESNLDSTIKKSQRRNV